MAKPRVDWIDRLQYLALRLAAMAMHAWPVSANLAAARALGDLMWAVDKRHRELCIDHLRRAMPQWDERRVRAVAKESLRQLFMLGVEVLFTPRLVKLENLTRHVDLGEFAASLRLLMMRERGLIVLTGHYGNWEILGYALATLGFETTSVARPLDNPYINEWLLGVRERMGQRIVNKKGATDDVTRVLGEGGVVGFIADQDAGKKGMFVDFFGRPASTYKSIGLVAMQYEVPIVVGYARRIVGQPFRFHIGTQDIIRPEDWKSQPDPLRYITQRYAKAIEDSVRGDPAQYLWVHRRWKTRPKGEVDATKVVPPDAIANIEAVPNV